MRAELFQLPRRRSRLLCEAFAGALRAGGRHEAKITLVTPADREVTSDAPLVAHYGLEGPLRDLHRARCREPGRFRTLLFDLGYWGRHEGGRYAGYHRAVFNRLHTAYDHAQIYDRARVERLGVPRAARAHLDGQYVVLIGQSDKAGWVYDLGPGEWEREAVETMRCHTDRDIYFVRKLSARVSAQPPAGTAPTTEPLAALFASAWAVVAHHSNALLDALLAGVPVFCADGMARGLAETDLTRIESPRRVSATEVDNLIACAANAQWTMAEVGDGTALRSFEAGGML